MSARNYFTGIVRHSTTKRKSPAGRLESQLNHDEENEMKTDDRFLQALALTMSLGLLGAWAGAVGSSSAAQAQRPVPVVSAGDAVPEQPRGAFSEAEAQADPIREVYADGGYWYWLEHDPAR